MPERDKKTDLFNVPLYAIKTFGREKAKLEGESVTDSRSDFNHRPDRK